MTTDTITLPRSVVEQVLNTLQWAAEIDAAYDGEPAHEFVDAITELTAAIEAAKKREAEYDESEELAKLRAENAELRTLLSRAKADALREAAARFGSNEITSLTWPEFELLRMAEELEKS